MGLNIYTSTDPASKLSADATFSNPLAFTFNGINGGTEERKLYIRNDDVANAYVYITIAPIDGGDDLINSASGFSWKICAGDERPTTSQWDAITSGASLYLGDEVGVLDTVTYLPFWIKVSVPAGAPTNSFQSVSLRLSSSEVPL